MVGRNHTPTDAAERVSILTGMEMVSGGYQHTIAIKNDTLPPDLYVSGPNGWSRTDDLAFTLRTNEVAVVFECRIDGGSFYACGTSPAFNNLTEGEHTVS